jgi:hypothetical protein
MGRLHIPNVRHWAVRIHEAAVLLAAIRPAFICLPVAVESSCRSHRSIGILPFRCTASLLSSASLLDHLTSPHRAALQLGFYFFWFTHLTAPLDLASLFLVVVTLFVSLAAAATDLSPTLTAEARSSQSSLDQESCGSDGAAVRRGATAGASGPRRLVRLPRWPLPAEAVAPTHPQARPVPPAPARAGSSSCSSSCRDGFTDGFSDVLLRTVDLSPSKAYCASIWNRYDFC